jgi:hypothetical protein
LSLVPCAIALAVLHWWPTLGGGYGGDIERATRLASALLATYLLLGGSLALVEALRWALPAGMVADLPTLPHPRATAANRVRKAVRERWLPVVALPSALLGFLSLLWFECAGAMLLMKVVELGGLRQLWADAIYHAPPPIHTLPVVAAVWMLLATEATLHALRRHESPAPKRETLGLALAVVAVAWALVPGRENIAWLVQRPLLLHRAIGLGYLTGSVVGSALVLVAWGWFLRRRWKALRPGWMAPPTESEG